MERYVIRGGERGYERLQLLDREEQGADEDQQSDLDAAQPEHDPDDREEDDHSDAELK